MTLPHPVIESSLGLQLLERRGQSGKYEHMKAVYRLLVLHKGSIIKFALEVDELESCPDIDHWIHFLSNHDVQQFTLSRAKIDPYKLPYYLFTFQHLTHLKFLYCTLRPPRSKDLVRSLPSCHTLHDLLEMRAPNLINFLLIGEFGSLSFKKLHHAMKQLLLYCVI